MPIPAAALGLALEYDLSQERTTRLVDVRAAGLSSIAVLEVETRWTPAPEPVEPPRGITSLRGTALQTVQFDVRKGRFLGSTGTSELELVLTPAGSSQFIAVQASGRQVTGLSAAGGPGDTRPPRGAP